jgi:hypothetical protein
MRSFGNMTPLLIVHIGSGIAAIPAGAAALLARKGGRLHGGSGKAFVFAMLILAATAVVLALVQPPSTPSAAPPRASISIAVLTIYLVGTAWLTARRNVPGAVALEVAASATAFLIAATLLGFAAMASQSVHPGQAVPYAVFSIVPVLAGLLDAAVVVRGGIAGNRRIARHVWRMSLALFFATAFFFIGQQKVMPPALRGSLYLFGPPVAVLLMMAFWLVRLAWTRKPIGRPSPA